MLKIGLTGGIGSGKSTIANLFNHDYAIPIIDADIIAHQLVRPGQPALSAIKKQFGMSIINPDQTLNRDQLKQIVFLDKSKKKQLESILHPLIFQRMQIEFERQTAPYSILSIPLLIETQRVSFVDQVLVVDCTLETQIKRVQERDKLSKERILSIISSQASRQQRLAFADDIIDNSNSASKLAEQIKKLHNKYLTL